MSVAMSAAMSTTVPAPAAAPGHALPLGASFEVEAAEFRLEAAP
jgi:hypothetical protein